MKINHNRLQKSLIPLIAIFILSLSIIPVKAAESDNVRIEYQYVSDSELSQKELSHLEKGLPKIKATKDAKYLIVYKNSASTAEANPENEKNSSTPKTGQSASIVFWIISAPIAAYAIFKLKRKNAISAVLILCVGVAGISFGNTPKAHAYENKEFKIYNHVQTVPKGTELFKDIKNIPGYKMLGVIDAAKLQSSAENNNPQKPDNPNIPNNPNTPDNPNIPDNPNTPDNPNVPQPPITSYEDGEYLGEAPGRTLLKPVRVKVTVKNNKIIAITKQNENEAIDDGGSWEAQGFHALIKMILNQNKDEQKDFINSFSVDSTRLFNIAFAVHEEGHKTGGKKNNFKAAFDKYAPGIDESLLFDNMPEDAVVNAAKLHLIKLNKYHAVDAISGATYTGRGTINAIYNALEKANKNISLKDFSVVGGIKYNYIDGETLDLTNLKIKATFKDNSTKELLYDDFEKNGFSVMKIEGKEKKVKIGRTLILTEQGLSHPISHGVQLLIIHNKSNTARPVPTIRITPDIQTLTPEKILVRNKNSQEWMSSTADFDTKTFIQKISLSDENKKKLIGNEIEFGLVVRDKSNKEYVLVFKPENGQNMQGVKEEKEYSVKIEQSDLEKLNKKFAMQFMYWRITVLGEKANEEPEQPQTTKKLKPHMIFMKDSDDMEGNTRVPLSGKFDDNEFEISPENMEKAKKLKGKSITFEVVFKDEQNKEYTLEFETEDINGSDFDEYNYNGEEIIVSGTVINDIEEIEDEFEIDENYSDFTFTLKELD
ncbi:MAG: FMN-binding protein [Eubacteriales bacterium]|nr:FMN-binding protein [Eubacteriales bacterium]MDY3332342.1 FMN-binding protein [Gallibacter sp.]